MPEWGRGRGLIVGPHHHALFFAAVAPYMPTFRASCWLRSSHVATCGASHAIPNLFLSTGVQLHPEMGWDERLELNHWLQILYSTLSVKGSILIAGAVLLYLTPLCTSQLPHFVSMQSANSHPDWMGCRVFGAPLQSYYYLAALQASQAQPSELGLKCWPQYLHFRGVCASSLVGDKKKTPFTLTLLPQKSVFADGFFSFSYKKYVPRALLNCTFSFEVLTKPQGTQKALLPPRPLLGAYSHNPHSCHTTN